MKDTDLDILLSEYRKEMPTDFQMKKWKRAVRSELNIKKVSMKTFWLQLVAASVVGFLIGAIVFKSSHQDRLFQNFAQNDSDNATIEYVFTKIN